MNEVVDAGLDAVAHSRGGVAVGRDPESETLGVLDRGA